MSRVTALAVPAAAPSKGRSPSEILAANLGVDREGLVNTLKKTVIPGNASNEDIYAFCLVAANYKLNPLTREIFAYPKKGGGIQPVVSVDGWIKVVNNNDIDGIEFADTLDANGNLYAITCHIYRKGSTRPISITELYSECKRNSEPWNQMPHRMLRHKALIQCARVAFGISGLVDEDEGRDIAEQVPPPSPSQNINRALQATVIEAKAAKPAPAPVPEPVANNSTFTDADDAAVLGDADEPQGDAGDSDLVHEDPPEPTPEPEPAPVPPPAPAPAPVSQAERLTVLPENCSQTRFQLEAAKYAPGEMDPDTAEAFVQRKIPLLLGKVWAKATQAEKQRMFDKYVKGEIKFEWPQ
jgi:hypothetical protein